MIWRWVRPRQDRLRRDAIAAPRAFLIVIGWLAVLNMTALQAWIISVGDIPPALRSVQALTAGLFVFGLGLLSAVAGRGMAAFAFAVYWAGVLSAQANSGTNSLSIVIGVVAAAPVVWVWMRKTDPMPWHRVDPDERKP